MSGSISDQRPDPIPPFPTDDDKSAAYHVAMGSIDGIASLLPVPGLSYGAQQLVRQLIGEPLERRREKWFAIVGEGLRELQDRLDGFDPANLAGDEEFISVVAQATRAAMATHHVEKLESLRNAVLNTAAGMTVDEVTRGAFMAYLEQFSTLHLRLLQILRDPTSAPEIQGVGGAQLMEPLVPVLVRALAEVAEPTILDIAIKDLMGARLLNNPVDLNITPDPMSSRCVSPLGLEFLRFVASPLQ